MDFAVFASMRKKERRAELLKKKRELQSKIFLSLDYSKGWYHIFVHKKCDQQQPGHYHHERTLSERRRHAAKFRKIRKAKTEAFRFLDTRNKGTWSRRYHSSVVFMIIFSLGLGIGNSIRGYEFGILLKLRIAVESFLLVVFLTEYLLRIWSSGAHGTYGAAGGWKKYIITPHMIIDLLVIMSSLGLVISAKLHLTSEDRRLLYLLQLLRVVRIDRQRGAFSAFWRVFKRHRKELLTCWYMGFLMVIFVSFLVYALEEKTETKPYTLDNLFDGVYWGVISLTTIGYGDINPETTTGKILICCFAVFGTCFLAMPAGIIGSGFALQVAEQQKEKHVNRRRRPAAILIQSFWRKYAADNDYPATWLPHTQSREERPRRNGTQKKSDQMFGVSFSPIMPSIVGSRHDSKLSITNPCYTSSLPNSNRSLNKGGEPSKSGENSPELKPPANIRTAKTLTTAEKIALRFIRFLKCISSTKKFRQARRPYDERDILDQFASSQIEMFAKVRELKAKIEGCHNLTETKNTKTYKEVSKLEHKISVLTDDLTETKALLKLLLKTHGVDITAMTKTKLKLKKEHEHSST